MARVKINVDSTALAAAVASLETSKKFATREALLDELTATFGANHNPPLSKGLILSRLREFNTPMQTPPGKPGRPKGSKSKKATEPAAAAPASGGIEDGGNEPDLD